MDAQEQAQARLDKIKERTGNSAPAEACTCQQLRDAGDISATCSRCS